MVNKTGWSFSHSFFKNYLISWKLSECILCPYPLTCRHYQASASLYKQLIEKSKPAGVHHLCQKSSYFWAKKKKKRRWLSASQSAFETQQGFTSTIFSLEKKWFLECGGALRQASVWRHQIRIPTLNIPDIISVALVFLSAFQQLLRNSVWIKKIKDVPWTTRL